jgi:subtilase family serine protease
MRNRNVALSWALAAASARTGTFAGKRRHRTACILLALGICGLGVARGQEAATASVTPSRLVRPIDENALVTLRGNVRRDLTADRDLGPVEDGLPLRLYLILQRSPAQRAELDNLLARQQQPTAPEYHRWLAPKEFGARFGASPQDIAKLSAWLELHGLQVRSVLNNASMIDFAATAGQVRAVFHTQLHYYNIQGGKYAANAQDPQIPAALVPVVAGIEGLSKIPPQANHTPIRPVSYDAATHSWHNLDSAGDAKAFPAYSTGSGGYAVTPQDFYTIYNVNRIFSGGNLGANATIALVEYGDMQYGTVNATTGAATGGDVVTFRTLFGVPGTLNMHVYHGYGTVTCNDPGITGSEGEATLDAEWANALAPAANLIFMSCGGGPSTLAAIVDNNLSDAISNSFSIGELGATAAAYSTDDALYEQAAAQGQTIFDAAGDSGVDYHSAGTAGTATYGFNINATAASPLVTAAGGTDFADSYDSDMGGPARSTYWGDANSTYYSDALGYIPGNSLER